MKFDKNQKTFENYMQERIWEYGTRLVPLDITLPYVSDTLRDSCIDLYNFNSNLLEDMYHHYDEYGLAPDYEKDSINDKKRVDFYFYYLKGLTNLVGDQCKMPTKKYMAHAKKFNQKSIDALSRHGLKVEINDDITTVSNTVYPKMFAAIEEVNKAGFSNYKVNCSSYYIHCDFRALMKYNRTYKDLFHVLSDKDRSIAEALHQYAAERNIKPVNCTYFHRVEYKLKGKIVFIMDLADKNYLKINIGFANLHSAPYDHICSQIEGYDDADTFKKFCLKHLAKYCQNCNPACQNKTKPKDEIFGRKVIICSDKLFIRITNPDEQDLGYLSRLMDLRADLITRNISQPFYPGNG